MAAAQVAAAWAGGYVSAGRSRAAAAMATPCSSIGGGATAGFRLALPQRSIRATTRNKGQIVVACHYQRQEASASAPAPQIEAKSMEEVYEALAEHLSSVLKNIEHLDSKYIVGIAGPPGAGKSTVASEVVQRVNNRWSQKHDHSSSLISTEEIATMLPMDGFHLYRSQLDAMEDPKEAHARRGAPWTFDPSRFLKCLQTLREEGSVYAPSFDHGVGDPVENDIFVKPQHKIVIVEGNYLLLEEDVWRDIRALFDEKWFIDIDIDVSMQRVLKRHVATGKEPDVAAWRISYNDRPNAELIIKSKKTADLVIGSVDLSS
ncbi:putative uridine kinase C227.14 isoform X2 [Oryza brachyantha]|uniref:Phosphoribulokinase/uridine kinase domain-containing protein n=1 Tax=Oryza brachyantha TaxID=4533 RepID=J3NER2_ORYBR|nr:putative uridine kinase C227.14 isoform X2 [Oryza brachyantha]